MNNLWMLMVGAVMAEPSRFAASLDLGGAAHDMVVAPGGELAVFVSGGQLLVLDLETWQTTAAAQCSGATRPASYDRGDSWVFFAGCEDGSVAVVSVGDSSHSVTQEDSLTLSEEGSPILAVTVDDGTLYGLVDETDGNPSVHMLAQDGSGEISIHQDRLAYSGLQSTVLMPSYWLLLHGGRQLSKVQLGTGTPSTIQQTRSVDLREACAPSTAGTPDYAFAADSDGRIVLIQPASTNNELTYVISEMDAQVGIACSASIDDGEWIASISTGQLALREYINTAVTTEPIQSFDLESLGLPDMDEVKAASGYLLTLSAGDLYVFTDGRAWLSAELQDEGPFLEGESVELVLESDLSGDFTLNLKVEGGVELSSGTLVAGEPQTLTLSLESGTYNEGTNRLFVVLGDASVAVDVVVDSPPDQVVMDLGFGDETVLVNVSGSGEPDLVSYELYLSTSEFTGDALPDAEGPDEKTNPIVFDADSDGGDQTLTIDGLTNYTTYYVGVRAVDESGTEGPMSEIQMVTPEPTFSAAELAGESGGLSCSTNSHPGGLILGALAALALIARRRKSWLLGAALLAPGTALAQEDGGESEEQAQQNDELHIGWTHKTRTNALRYGPSQMTGGSQDSVDAWDTVYDGKIGGIEISGGYQLYRMLQLDGRIGVMRKSGSQSTDSGDGSGASTKMTVLPLGLGATLRLDPFLPHRQIGDEYYGMPLVPWVGASLDYYPWLERKGDLDTTDLSNFDGLGGGKAGWSWAVGADLLLDWMDPGRASLVEARWGIVDTYFTVSYRQSTMFEEQGLSFAGETLSFGLKIDRK